MEINSVFVLALFGVVVAKGLKELVLVQDLTSDHDKRHLDAGLPSVLTFNLRRETGNVTLTLEENRRLGENAPVFEGREDEQGEISLVRQESAPITDVRFYQDRTNMGVFSVRCQMSVEGPCTRMMTGNVYIDGRNFDIEPAPETEDISQRDVIDVNSFGIPHLLHENEAKDLFNREMFIHDAIPIPDAGEAADDKVEETGELEFDLDGLGKNEDTRQYSSGPNRNQYVVEILIVLDYSVWKKYYDMTSETGTMTRAEATDLRLRKHFSLVIMGVNLRYESIDDPEMYIYCTISGFIINKNRDNSNPLPPGREIFIDGEWYADATEYIVGLVQRGWINSLKGTKNLPATDHIMIFTAYELYDAETGDDATEGLAYLGGICTSTRVSVNEIGGFFLTTSLATHELGHNLGADHDGEDAAKSCHSPGNYIMAPYIAEFDDETIYSINPWRFSTCSVNAFKSMMKYLNGQNCLTNPADEYAHEEYKNHASRLPGELHSANAQCQLLHGEQSRLCKETDMTNICLVMKCLRADGECIPYAAARGTACKGPDTEKWYWCIDGACVEKEFTGILITELQHSKTYTMKFTQ